MNTKHDEHEFVDALLPWYLNGSLEENDLQRVVLHLAACTQCRSALSFLESLDTDLATLYDCEEHNHRLPDDLHRQLSRPRRWAWPAALAASVVLAFGLGMNSVNNQLNEPAYRTATSSAASSHDAVAIVDIRFAEDASVDDLGRVLQRFDNVVLTGPREGNWYRLEIPIDSTRAGKNLQQQLATTRGIVDVQPVATTGER